MGPETDLPAALTGTLINAASPQELNQLFRRCMIKVGIRANNLPAKEETIILYNHLVKNYGGHTTEEIDLAFEMAITGKLDLEDSEVTSYENFSCLYLSKILNAYRKWAAQVMPHITHLHESLKQLEFDFDWRGLIQSDYEKLLFAKVNYKLFPVEYYEQLVSDGFISPFVYKDMIVECRKELCSEIHLRITVEKDLHQEEVDQYNNTQDLERLLLEYRTGKRDIEVVLLAKQVCVWMLFQQAQEKGFKQIYVKE